MRASLYVHVPFCERKCLYCDFYSVETTGPVERFLEALRKETALYARLAKEADIETVFLGGGTPSLLSPEQLASILGWIRQAYRVTPDAEVTMETNPGTVSPGTLAGYRAAGVNRLSIGVQSFDPAELAFLSRIHSGDEAVACVQMAREAGFANLSLDLIYALPGQTQEAWMRTLARAVSLGPEHISAYGLIVEDHTPLARLVEKKLVSPAPVEQEALLFEVTMRYLAEREYEHYEVSNYARPGFRSRHNCNYWSHVNYIGLGPSAHSFWRDGAQARRWSNIANISAWCDGVLAERPIFALEETVGPRDLANELIFLGLRSDGLEPGRLAAECGLVLDGERAQLLGSLVEEGLAVRDGERLRLTPAGFLLCDEIAGRLMF